MLAETLRALCGSPHSLSFGSEKDQRRSASLACIPRERKHAEQTWLITCTRREQEIQLCGMSPWILGMFVTAALPSVRRLIHPVSLSLFWTSPLTSRLANATGLLLSTLLPGPARTVSTSTLQLPHLTCLKAEEERDTKQEPEETPAVDRSLGREVLGPGMSRRHGWCFWDPRHS